MEKMDGERLIASINPFLIHLLRSPLPFAGVHKGSRKLVLAQTRVKNKERQEGSKGSNDKLF